MRKVWTEKVVATFPEILYEDFFFVLLLVININMLVASVNVYGLNRMSLCCRETGWEWRFCPCRLNRPHTSCWTSQCSVFMLNIGCWASQWRRQRRPCPSANPERGRRFTITSHEVRTGELCVCLFLERFDSKAPQISLSLFVSPSDLCEWFPGSSSQTVSVHHVGGQWSQPGQVVSFF